MSDIEQALADALHDYEADCRYRWVFVAPDSSDNHYERTCEAADHQAEAAAILATPSMQAIARQAAIGAAVERLEQERDGCAWHLEWMPGPNGYRWEVTLDDSPGPPRLAMQCAPTLPAAIAAALGEDDVS